MSQCSELSIGTSASYWSPYKSKVNHFFILCQPFPNSLSTISSFFVNHFQMCGNRTCVFGYLPTIFTDIGQRIKHNYIFFIIFFSITDFCSNFAP